MAATVTDQRTLWPGYVYPSVWDPATAWLRFADFAQSGYDRGGSLASFGYNGGASMCAGLFRITDPDPAATVVVTSRTIASNAASEDSPSLNPTGPDDLLLCLLANTGANSAFSSTHPSGMTDLGQTQLSNLFMGLAAAKELLPNSSATGVRTWTSVSPTGRQGGAFSIAVASVSAEPPGPRRLPWLTR